MLRPSFYVLAFAAIIAAAVTPAAAGSCCACASACAPSYGQVQGQVQVWAPSYQPYYRVNQGPDYSGNYLYALPTIEAAPPAYYRQDYSSYPVGPAYRSFRRPYSQSFRHRVYRHETDLRFSRRAAFSYRHAFGPRALTVSTRQHWAPRDRRLFNDPRVR